MAIYSEFSHEKLWFSIVMLVYQRVYILQSFYFMILMKSNRFSNPWTWRHSPPQDALRKLRRAVRAKMQSFASRDVANVSWAMAAR